jgi:hypothetical protein
MNLILMRHAFLLELDLAGTNEKPPHGGAASRFGGAGLWSRAEDVTLTCGGGNKPAVVHSGE